MQATHILERQMHPTNSSRPVTRVFACTLILLCGLGSPLSAAALPRFPPGVPASGPDRRSNLATIQSLLEERFGVSPLPAKAVQKLHRLPDRQIAQIAALCGRIAEEPNAPGGNLALLLITTVIILS